MAALLGCDAVSLEYPTKVILKGVTLGVADGDRFAEALDGTVSCIRLI